MNIAHVEDLTNVFRGFGVDARYISSKTPAPERRALVAAFKAGQFPVLVNCGMYALLNVAVPLSDGIQSHSD